MVENLCREKRKRDGNIEVAGDPLSLKYRRLEKTTSDEEEEKKKEEKEKEEDKKKDAGSTNEFGSSSTSLNILF